MKTINETNYFESTTALFTIVEDEKEKELIMNLTPVHVNERAYRNNSNVDEFDHCHFFDEKELSELTDEEKEQGVIGHVINFDAVDIGFNEYEDYYAYIFEKKGNWITYGEIPELISKTFLHNNHVYRYSYYWGNIASCKWDLDVPNFEDGNQSEFILAKCELKDFVAKDNFNKCNIN